MSPHMRGMVFFLWLIITVALSFPLANTFLVLTLGDHLEQAPLEPCWGADRGCASSVWSQECCPLLVLAQ